MNHKIEELKETGRKLGFDIEHIIYDLKIKLKRVSFRGKYKYKAGSTKAFEKGTELHSLSMELYNLQRNNFFMLEADIYDKELKNTCDREIVVNIYYSLDKSKLYSYNIFDEKYCALEGAIRKFNNYIEKELNNG